MVVSRRRSPEREAADDSPDKDFLSSVSAPLGGEELVVEDEEVINDRERRDMERSKGESERNKTKHTTI